MDHCTDEELCVQGHIASKRQRPDLKLGVSDDRGEHPSIRCTQDAFAEPSLHSPALLPFCPVGYRLMPWIACWSSSFSVPHCCKD